MTNPILTHIAALAEKARPINDDDWGSDRQVYCQNDFFIEMEEAFPHLMTDDFERWCLKATSEEMIDEAMRMIRADLSQGENP